MYHAKIQNYQELLFFNSEILKRALRDQGHMNTVEEQVLMNIMNILSIQNVFDHTMLLESIDKNIKNETNVIGSNKNDF